jgi:hypothetical protein
LDPGVKYYWTVVPYDGSSRGICTNSVRSFRLNTPPTLDPVGLQEISTGEEFKMLLSSTDEDIEDKTGLKF